MKSNELQIGDLVQVSQSDEKTAFHIDKVTELFDDGSFNTHLFKSIQDYCEPIPLTVDMMTLNGFVVMKSTGSPNQFFYMDNMYPVILLTNTQPKYFMGNCTQAYEGGEEHTRFGVYRCKYVHDLQHLLRLARHTELADKFDVSSK